MDDEVDDDDELHWDDDDNWTTWETTGSAGGSATSDDDDPEDGDRLAGDDSQAIRLTRTDTPRRRVDLSACAGLDDLTSPGFRSRISRKRRSKDNLSPLRSWSRLTVHASELGMPACVGPLERCSPHVHGTLLGPDRGRPRSRCARSWLEFLSRSAATVAHATDRGHGGEAIELARSITAIDLRDLRHAPA